MERKRGFRNLAAVATVALAALLLAITPALATGTSPAPPQLQVVLDTSASVPTVYKLQALPALARVVGAWPRPLSAVGGSPAQPGLVVQLRGVSADSYAPTAVLGTWTVRGVPGVKALPTTITADFTQQVLTYKRQRAAAASAYRHAKHDASVAAAAIGALRPKTTYASEIEGAVSAAAQSFSPAGARKLVVVSDLDQNRQAQIAGSLHGVDVLIGHICWKVASCSRQERAVGDILRQRHAKSVTFVRIERFAGALTTFVGER